jgi:hypothetical protein
MSSAITYNAPETCEAFQDPDVVRNILPVLATTILIQIRLELARRIGNEPPLTGLIRVYKDYYPDVIVGDVTNGRSSVFTVSFLLSTLMPSYFMLIFAASKS